MSDFYIWRKARSNKNDHASVLDIVNIYTKFHALPHVTQLNFDINGRPFLPAQPLINLSYAHSKNWLVVALSRKGSVGIDIEPLARQKKIKSLVWPTAFSFDECQHLTSRNCLFQWTLKEAALKMCGLGFSQQAPNTYTVDRKNQQFLLRTNNQIITTGYWQSWKTTSERITFCYHL